MFGVYLALLCRMKPKSYESLLNMDRVCVREYTIPLEVRSGELDDWSGNERCDDDADDDDDDYDDDDADDHDHDHGSHGPHD